MGKEKILDRFGIVINKDGFKVDFVVLNEEGIVQFYNLKDGEEIIEMDWQLANSMVAPKWENNKWIETGEPIIPEPTPPGSPSLEERLLECEKINASLLIEIANLKAGGDTNVAQDY